MNIDEGLVDEKFSICMEGDVVKLIINQNTNIDLLALKSVLRALKKEGHQKPTIVYLKPELTIEREAREYLHKVNKRFKVLPIAIISNTLNEMLIANFYHKFYRPDHLYKIFRSEVEAFQWIKN